MTSEGKNYLLVVDTLRVTDAKKICIEKEKEWGLLYSGTEWQQQLQNSPMWVKLSPHDDLWRLWENDFVWGTSSIILSYSNSENINDVVSSLQKNITVQSGDGRLFFFRFYSPYTLSVINNYGDEDIIYNTLGLADSAYFSPTVSGEYAVYTIVSPLRDEKPKSFSLPTALIEELLQ